MLKEAKGVVVGGGSPPCGAQGGLLPLSVLAHAAVPARRHLWGSRSSRAQLTQASPFSPTAAAWSLSLGAFWKSVNPLRANGRPARSKEARGVGAGGRVGRRREMGLQGRGRRGDVPLPRRGLFPVTHTASRGVCVKGPAPPRVA